MFDKSKIKIKTAKKAKDIEMYCYYWLSQREFSIKELTDKITRKFENYDDYMDEAIENLIKSNNLSEDRFIASYVRMKFNDDYGKIKIKMDLKHKKGIDGADAELEFENYDWYELAKDYRLRKFGENIDDDFKSMKKKKDKMLRRGFSYDEINYAFEND